MIEMRIRSVENKWGRVVGEQSAIIGQLDSAGVRLHSTVEHQQGTMERFATGWESRLSSLEYHIEALSEEHSKRADNLDSALSELGAETLTQQSALAGAIAALSEEMKTQYSLSYRNRTDISNGALMKGANRRDERDPTPRTNIAELLENVFREVGRIRADETTLGN